MTKKEVIKLLSKYFKVIRYNSDDDKDKQLRLWMRIMVDHPEFDVIAIHNDNNNLTWNPLTLYPDWNSKTVYSSYDVNKHLGNINVFIKKKQFEEEMSEIINESI